MGRTLTTIILTLLCVVTLCTASYLIYNEHKNPAQEDKGNQDITITTPDKPNEDLTTDYKSKYELLLTSYNTLESQVTSLENDLQTSESNYNACSTELTSIKSDLTSIKSALDSHADIPDMANNETSAVKNSLLDYVAFKVADLETEVTQLTNRVTSLNNSLDVSNEKLTDAHIDNIRLTALGYVDYEWDRKYRELLENIALARYDKNANKIVVNTEADSFVGATYYEVYKSTGTLLCDTNTTNTSDFDSYLSTADGTTYMKLSLPNIQATNDGTNLYNLKVRVNGCLVTDMILTSDNIEACSKVYLYGNTHSVEYSVMTAYTVEFTMNFIDNIKSVSSDGVTAFPIMPFEDYTKVVRKFAYTAETDDHTIDYSVDKYVIVLDNNYSTCKLSLESVTSELSSSGVERFGSEEREFTDYEIINDDGGLIYLIFDGTAIGNLTLNISCTLK